MACGDMSSMAQTENHNRFIEDLQTSDPDAQRLLPTGLGGERSLPLRMAQTMGGELSATSLPEILSATASAARWRPSINRRREMASRRPASQWRPPSVSTGGKKTGMAAAASRIWRNRSMPTGSIFSASLGSAAGVAGEREGGWTAAKAILLRGQR